MADLAGNFVAGSGIGVFRVEAPGGDYLALPTICFEVAYDGLMRDSVLAAGDEESLLVVQTNNATFGHTAESEQQFAISRIRAIEHGRSVVHVSTVGVSGFVAPDGTVSGRPACSRPSRSGSTRRALGARHVGHLGAAPGGSPQGSCSCWCSGASGSRGALGFSHHPIDPTRTDRCLEAARPPPRVAVLIPTYDGQDTLPVLVRHLREVVPDLDLDVLDSPDGTGEVADALAARPRSRSSTGPARRGLGAAYLAGFRWSLDQGYDAVVEMDADGSHRPEHLPALLAAAADADAVIGSRWVRRGSVVNWPLYRKALSVGGSTCIQLLLGMRVNDATAGFRVYRADALRHGARRRRLAGLPSRPTSRGARSRPACASWRCPSPSSSGRSSRR